MLISVQEIESGVAAMMTFNLGRQAGSAGMGSRCGGNAASYAANSCTRAPPSVRLMRIVLAQTPISQMRKRQCDEHRGSNISI